MVYTFTEKKRIRKGFGKLSEKMEIVGLTLLELKKKGNKSGEKLQELEKKSDNLKDLKKQKRNMHRLSQQSR